MLTTQITRTFLDYYRDRGHELVRGTSLIPTDGDPVLFTTSGMHPLTPYLEGRPHPDGRRLVNLQRCLRTTDLDEVGDSTHLTVFQMLGTWSLGGPPGGYDGPQSLRWGVDLLVDGLDIDKGRLHATVFGGDDQVPPDIDSMMVWDEVGVPVELTTGDNWWSNGPVGPCGPDSEMFVWTGDGPPTGTPSTDSRWVEVWNHVMMRYRRHGDGALTPLDQPNVDTGMGLERIAMVLQGTSSVYDIDILQPWCRQVESTWGLEGSDVRLVSDHLRSSIVVVGDGVRPSNTGRGYVLRRLLRRALTTLWLHDIDSSLRDLPDGVSSGVSGDLSGDLIDLTRSQFSLVGRGEGGGRGSSGGVDLWREIVGTEEDRYRNLLERGRRLVTKMESRGPLTDTDRVFLQQTHGIPHELLESPLMTSS